MAFRIKQTETIEAGLKRILREQMGKAEKELVSATDENIHGAIHQARKRCKKIRGVYRLVRRGIPQAYKSENARFRDSAGNLSAVRDSEAMIETYDRLMERFGKNISSRREFGNIRLRLTLDRNAAAKSESGMDSKIEDFLASLREAKSELKKWSLPDTGFENIEAGLRKTYKRGRKAMRRAFSEPTDANFHQWRKRVKYFWYQIRALRGLWPAMFNPLERETKRLGKLLGNDHDLAGLMSLMEGRKSDFIKAANLDAFLDFAKVRRKELKAEARSLGERLYAARPKDLSRLCRRCWHTWKAGRTDKPRRDRMTESKPLQ